jgi:nitrite reductase (NADH) large subunit
VLATGSYPFVPPLPGNERKDCFVYRTIEDLEAMLECGSRSKSGVVIGGGLLGLECAKALRDLKLETHVVEFAPRLMAVQVDESGGRVLRQKIEELGVTAHTQEHGRDRRWQAAHPSHEFRRRLAPGNRHDRVLRRHPPARRTGAPGGLKVGAGAASSSTTTASPPTRPSTPSANARCGTARSSAWWRPGYDMARVPPSTCSHREKPSKPPSTAPT